MNSVIKSVLLPSCCVSVDNAETGLLNFQIASAALHIASGTRVVVDLTILFVIVLHGVFLIVSLRVFF